MNIRDQNFIQAAIEKNNIAAIVDKADSSEIKYPVAIVSYKNRYDWVFKHLEEHCVPFMVFVYADDFIPSGYNKYHFKYGKFVHITKEDFAKYGFHGKAFSENGTFCKNTWKTQAATNISFWMMTFILMGTILCVRELKLKESAKL